MRRTLQIAGIVGLVSAAIWTAPASGTAAVATVSVQPTSVPVHGTVTITGSCPMSGPTATALIIIRFKDSAFTYDEGAGLPLLEDGDFVLDLPLRRGARGAHEVILSCSAEGASSMRADADPGLLVNDEPELPLAPLPTISSPYRIEAGGPIPVTGTCPETEPAADRVLFQQRVDVGEGRTQPTSQYVDLDATGRVEADLAPAHPQNDHTHTVTMYCLAGDRFLGRNVGRTYRIVPPTPTTTASPTTTEQPATTAAPPGQAPGAPPIAASPSYTG